MKYLPLTTKYDTLAAHNLKFAETAIEAFLRGAKGPSITPAARADTGHLVSVKLQVPGWGDEPVTAYLDIDSEHGTRSVRLLSEGKINGGHHRISVYVYHKDHYATCQTRKGFSDASESVRRQVIGALWWATQQVTEADWRLAEQAHYEGRAWNAQRDADKAQEALDKAVAERNRFQALANAVEDVE